MVVSGVSGSTFSVQPIWEDQTADWANGKMRRFLPDIRRASKLGQIGDATATARRIVVNGLAGESCHKMILQISVNDSVNDHPPEKAVNSNHQVRNHQ
jgi:hypothetical protein